MSQVFNTILLWYAPGWLHLIQLQYFGYGVILNPLRTQYNIEVDFAWSTYQKQFQRDICNSMSHAIQVDS